MLLPSFALLVLVPLTLLSGDLTSCACCSCSVVCVQEVCELGARDQLARVMTLTPSSKAAVESLYQQARHLTNDSIRVGSFELEQSTTMRQHQLQRREACLTGQLLSPSLALCPVLARVSVCLCVSCQAGEQSEEG